MKLIQQFYFSGDTEEALALYKRAFGCKVKSLLHNSDAVKNGWEKPNESIDHLVYHSEILFDGQEIRMADSFNTAKVNVTKEVSHIVGFDTEQEVEKAFAVLSEQGEVITPLERPPYMVITGCVKDRFGLKWELMCDFQ